MSTRDNRFTPAAHRSGFEARQARANQKAAENLAPTIAELQAAGVTSLRGIVTSPKDVSSGSSAIGAHRFQAITSTIQAADRLRPRSLCWPKRCVTAVQVANVRSWPIFSGFGFEDKVPSHSGFSRARNERFRDHDIFRQVFERIVGACIQAGRRRLPVELGLLFARRGRMARDRRTGPAQAVAGTTELQRVSGYGVRY
jgi:hypothetical protein